MRWKSGRRSTNVEDRRRVQHQSKGYVTPDSFTHGSSRQRVRWFKEGIKTGDVTQCNTFRADNL